MHLLDLFESTVEGYTVTRGIDRDRYQERAGLEGPFQTKSGKVVYYDAKAGQYYDPDTDMYIDDEDYRELDEGVGTYLKGAVLAGLLGLGLNQMADMASAKNSPLGQAMAAAAEQGDEYAAKHLKKLDLYMDSNDTGSIKILSKKYLNKTVESVYEEVATNKRTERILGLLRAKNPTAQNDLEALILSFEKGQRQDREDINTLYSQNREEDQEIAALEKELERIKNKRKVSEDYYETDEQRELARLGRIIMDMGKKRDDDVGRAMGIVGNELTKYGTPQGASNIKKLEKVTGQPESVIMKMMALAQKVKGDVAVGDETAGNNDEEEVKETLRKVPYAGYKGPGSDFRAYDEPDQRSNWVVKVGGKKWKVFANEKTARKAAYTVQQKYGKDTEVYATMDPVSEGAAKDFDDKFRKNIDLYTKSQSVRDYRAKKAQMNLDQMKATDPGNINPLIIDKPKAHSKARKAGVPQSVITTNQNRKLPEAVETDIQVGDTVQTLKMGQMKGTVTGFSKKSGITKVLFKHESGKTYATVPENLKVIDSINEQTVNESVQNFISVGIPKEYAEKFLKKYQVKHDAKITPTDGVPKASDISRETFIINVLPNGDVRGFGKKGDDWKVGKNFYSVLHMVDGKFTDTGYESLSAAKKGMSKQGKFYTLDGNMWSFYRDKKPDSARDTRGDVMTGDGNIYGYMNDTFMTKMRPMMEKMVDDIYANLRKLDNKNKSFASPSDQERALEAAKIIEEIAERGFNRATMENFLTHLKRVSHGFASIPANERELRKILKDTPNARAKWAKTVLDAAKRQHERVKQMLYGPTMDKLTADIHQEDAVKKTEGLDDTVVEAKKKPVPTNPELWSRAKAAAKQKYDVWPSAYSSAYAAKWYKEKGGGWRMGKPKK